MAALSTPPAGPDFERRDGHLGCNVGRSRATARDHDAQRRIDASLAEARRQLIQVFCDDRLNEGIRGGRRRPLVLAYFAGNPRRKGNRDARQSASQSIPHADLVFRIDAGMQKRNRDGLNAGSLYLFDDGIYLSMTRCSKDDTIGGDPFGKLEPVFAFDQWLRHLDIQIVEVVTHLAANIDDIGGAFGCDQRRPGAFAFDERISHQCAAMNDFGYSVRRAAASIQLTDGCKQIVDHIGKCLSWIGLGCQTLRQPHLSSGGVFDDAIGERAANVDSNPVVHKYRPRSSVS